MAYTINNVTLVGGNLTRDPEYSQPGGNALLKFDIAMNYSVKVNGNYEERADFFKVEYWGKHAEAIKTILKKGSKIAVQGRLSQDRWKDKDGNNRSMVKVSASNVVLMDSKKTDNGNTGDADYQHVNAEQPPQVGPGVNEDGLPF